MKKEAPVKNIGYSVLQIKSFDSETRTIKGVATTPTPDRVGDIVEPLGVSFTNPLVLLHQHDHDSPVGTVVFDKPTAKGITFTATLPVISQPGKLKDRVDLAWQEVVLGLIRAVSIGFRPIEHSWMDEGGIRFLKSEVYELSLVSVPAQAEAVITSVKSFDKPLSREVVQTIKSICNKETGALATKSKPVVNIKNPSGVSDKSKQKSLGVDNMATIAEKIKGYKDALDIKVKRMGDLLDEVSEEGLTFDEAQDEEFNTLDAEAKSLTSQIEKLEKFEKMNIEGAKPVEDKSKGVSTSALRMPVVAKAEKLEPGIEFARYAMCQLAAKGNPYMAFDLAKRHYGSNERVVKALEMQSQGMRMDTLMKATVEAGTTLDSTWAAPLVDYQNFAGDFVEFLRPQTIIGQFGVGGVPSLNRIPFNVRIAAQTSGGSAQWVGEGAPKPLTSFDFTATELRWAKVAAISVLTNELIRFGDPSAERLVRDSLAGAVIERIDLDFVDPAKAASSNISPASITNGLTPIPASGTGTADDIRADIRNLWAPFITANNAPRGAVYIMDSTTALALSMMQNPLGQSEFPGLTMNGGTFMGVPVVVSDYLPVSSGGHIVVLANARDIWLADDGQVTIDASQEASLQMDSAPTNNSATGTATSLVSMFQTNSTAFRAERYINWARRRTTGVAYLSDVNWGA